MTKNKSTHNRSMKSFARDNRTYLILFLSGLLVRLVIMPYFAHVDLFSEYRRVFKTIELGSYFPDLKRLVVYYTELLFLKLSLPLISDSAATFHFTDLASSTADLESFFLFINHDNIHRILFFFKLPYLLFDIGTFFLLKAMIKERSKQKWALGIWWFNPITIFAFYLFGRYESIPLFFIMLTLFCLQRKKVIFSAIALGFAVNGLEVNIIYLPLYFLSIIRPSDGDKPWGRYVVLKILPAILMLAALCVGPTLIRQFTGVESVLFGNVDTLGVHPIQNFFSMRHHWFVPFFFTYCLVSCWLLISKASVFHKFTFAGAFCVLSFLVFVEHSAHYASWLMVFMAGSLYFTKRIISPFICFCLAWVLLWLFMTDAGVLTLFLATPLSPNFFGVPTIPQLYTENFGAGGVIDLTSLIWVLRNIYAAVLVVIAYTLYNVIKADDNA